MTKTPKTLTTDECDKLLNELYDPKDFRKCSPKDIRNHIIALLMLDAGLRVGEVVALQISDLFYNGEPVVTLLVRPEISKTKTERSVPISDRLRSALIGFKKAYRWLSTKSEIIYCFTRSCGNPHITTRQVERIIRAAAQNALGRPIHPHILRHTFASRLMRKANIRVVQELLGHKSLISTQIYTHPNGEDLKNAINCLD